MNQTDGAADAGAPAAGSDFSPAGHDRRRPGGNVSDRVVRSGALLLAGQFCIRIIGVGTLAAMGRLLSPNDYGIVALALVVTGLFEVLTDLQVGAAIMRMKTVTDRDFDTAFLISFVRGALLAALVFISAPLAAQLLGDKQLIEVLRWLAAIPLIGACWNPRFILYERNIDFRAEFGLSLSAALIGCVATVVLGFVLQNYWALIYGNIIAISARVALPYFFVRYVPRFSLYNWRSFISFGGWLTAANIVSYVNYRSDAILVGRHLGQIQLGYYSMGDRVTQLATNEFVQPFVRAFYPGLLSVSDDGPRLKAAYYKTQQIILAFALPVGISAAICAREIVVLVAGPKWMQAAIVMQIIAPVMALNIMSSAVQALVMSVGNTRSLFERNLFNLVLRLPIVITGLWFGGLVGMLAARAVCGLVFTLSTLALARQQTGDPFWQPFIFAWRSIMAAAIMACVMFAAVLILDESALTTMSAALSVVTLGGLGGATYIVVHLAAWQWAGRPDGPEATLLRYIGLGYTLLKSRANQIGVH